MKDILIHDAVLAGRGVAFIIGCLAFYLAFFLYEDEEGRWQNRIDDLWIAVHDRARVTDSLSTALFNKIAQALVAVFNSIFGRRLVSFQMFAVSTNLSLAGASLGLLIVTLLDRSDPDFRAFFIGSSSSFLILLILASLAIRFPRRWVAITTLLPFWFTFFLVLRVMSVRSDGSMDDVFAIGDAIRNLLEALPMFLLFSLVSDAVAIAVIRKLFASISKSLSFVGILKMVGILVFLLLAILPIPFFALEMLSQKFQNQDLKNFAEGGRYWILYLNGTTGFYCLFPVLMLVVVLAHRLIWPTLARLLYAVSRNHILVNRKALATIGGMGITVAFDLEHVGIKEILKLLS
jgi:hypothetical protein